MIIDGCQSCTKISKNGTYYGNVAHSLTNICLDCVYEQIKLDNIK